MVQWETVASWMTTNDLNSSVPYSVPFFVRITCDFVANQLSFLHYDRLMTVLPSCVAVLSSCVSLQPVNPQLSCRHSSTCGRLWCYVVSTSRSVECYCKTVYLRCFGSLSATAAFFVSLDVSQRCDETAGCSMIFIFTEHECCVFFVAYHSSSVAITACVLSQWLVFS